MVHVLHLISLFSCIKLQSLVVTISFYMNIVTCSICTILLQGEIFIFDIQVCPDSALHRETVMRNLKVCHKSRGQWVVHGNQSMPVSCVQTLASMLHDEYSNNATIIILSLQYRRFYRSCTLKWNLAFLWKWFKSQILSNYTAGSWHV